ncbi:MAG: acyl-CoA dehydrogenase family protein, partial [Acidimicrobiia bacterium]|nr:acyl-CoA dehydrogenase family protein [Acidimicrobiia bacterium]
MDLSPTAEQEALRREVRAWLQTNLPWEYGVGLPPRFDDLAQEVAFLRQWQSTLASGKWVGVAWPAEYGGRGLGPAEHFVVQEELARARAPELVGRIGVNLAGPTLLAHGSAEQKPRWLPKILSADELWCQLFSEPGAGSDLASVSTRADAVEGGWVLNGQKVWTSYAQFADWGVCLARTDADAPKHKGISYLVVDMQADGIDVRPLRQITGEAEFNEVFLDEVFVPADHLVGRLHEGWAVANTTLAHERGTNFPFKEQVVHETYLTRLYDEARANGSLDDPVVADALTRAYVDLGVLRLHNLRTLTRLGRGEEPGPESSWVKLTWTHMTEGLSEAALLVTGRDPTSAEAGPWARQWLWSKASGIAGGTSQVQ